MLNILKLTLLVLFVSCLNNSSEEFDCDITMKIMKVEMSEEQDETFISIKCKLINNTNDSIYTLPLGFSHNYFRIITPDSLCHWFPLAVKILNLKPMIPGETKIWESGVCLPKNVNNDYFKSKPGHYKIYWMFHGKLNDKPIRLEKFKDGTYKLLNYLE